MDNVDYKVLWGKLIKVLESKIQIFENEYDYKSAELLLHVLKEMRSIEKDISNGLDYNAIWIKLEKLIESKIKDFGGYDYKDTVLFTCIHREMRIIKDDENDYMLRLIKIRQESGGKAEA